MRDHVLAPGAPANANLGIELNRIQRQNVTLFTAYADLVLPDERPSLEILRERAASYLDALRAAVAAQTGGRRNESLQFFRENLLTHRKELLSLIAQVNALDQRDMAAGEERIQTLHQQFEQRVRSLSLLALVLSTILAAAVFLRQQHVERQSSRHFDEVQSARRDLRMLSNRLVTAQEEERRNLSRELHDEIGQSLTAILMDVNRLEPRLAHISGCAEILENVRQTTHETVARVRDMSLLLRPSMLDELGLIPALRWQVREVARRSGLHVRLIADEIEQELPEPTRIGVYRIVQEALHNCVKHASASEVRVVIQREADALMVSIQDNGVGFDARKERGLGLLGIEERVRRLAGSVGIQSQPGGGGTVLSAHLPLARLDASIPQEELA
jgi:signal transduction histidine kinase